MFTNVLRVGAGGSVQVSYTAFGRRARRHTVDSITDSIDNYCRFCGRETLDPAARYYLDIAWAKAGDDHALPALNTMTTHERANTFDEPWGHVALGNLSTNAC